MSVYGLLQGTNLLGVDIANGLEQAGRRMAFGQLKRLWLWLD
jgi:hypothetical protein